MWLLDGFSSSKARRQLVLASESFTIPSQVAICVCSRTAYSCWAKDSIFFASVAAQCELPHSNDSVALDGWQAPFIYVLPLLPTTPCAAFLPSEEQKIESWAGMVGSLILHELSGFHRKAKGAVDWSLLVNKLVESRLWKLEKWGTGNGHKQ